MLIVESGYVVSVVHICDCCCYYKKILRYTQKMVVVVGVGSVVLLQVLRARRHTRGHRSWLAQGSVGVRARH